MFDMNDSDAAIDARRAALQADGYSYGVAEALAQHGVTVEEAQHLSKREVLDHYLEWNGIIGFTDGILAALQNAEENCNL